MGDVAIMGVVVVVMSLRSLRSKGVIIAARSGLLSLFAAEVCHYFAHYLVTRASQQYVCDVAKETPDDPEDSMPVTDAVVHTVHAGDDSNTVLEANPFEQ